MTNRLQRPAEWLAAFNPSLKAGLLVAFLFGFAVRMIPELLSYPYPIGFDTISYGWRIEEGLVWTHWSGVFDSWLLYALLVPLHSLMKVEPFVLLKLTMPLLFGLNACGVLYLAVKGLNWSVRKGMFAAGLFSFQLAALRISSDLYRNMLGLAILLFALPLLLREKMDSKSLVLFGVSSLLVVFSHELVSVLLLVSIFGVVVADALNRRRKEVLKVVGAALPALTVFFASIALRIYPLYQSPSPRILSAYQTAGQYSGPLFFITNYLAASEAVPSYVSYFSLFTSVASLFAVLYVAILPLGVVGFFRNRVLDVWAAFLCVGAFSGLVLPFFAFVSWHRWMIMLVFPLIFYATNGFVKILQSARPVSAMLWRFGSLRISKRAAKGLVLISVASGFAFITSPMFLGKTGVYALPTTATYLPSTILANTVPTSDTERTVEALRWADVAMDGNSCFLAHSAFFYWARFSFEGEHTIVLFNSDVRGAMDLAAEKGFERCWLVWWNTDIGWYGSDPPKDFLRVHDFGRISVYKYVKTMKSTYTSP